MITEKQYRELRKIPVEEMEFDKITLAYVKKAGFKKLGQIVDKLDELDKIKWVTYRAKNGIKSFLKTYGIIEYIEFQKRKNQTYGETSTDRISAEYEYGQLPVQE